MFSRFKRSLRRVLLWTCGLLAIALAVLAVRSFWRGDEVGYFTLKDTGGTDGQDCRWIIGSYRGGVFWLGSRTDVANFDWYGGEPSEIIINSAGTAVLASEAQKWKSGPFVPVGIWTWGGFGFEDDQCPAPTQKSFHQLGFKWSMSSLVVPDWILLLLLGWAPFQATRQWFVVRHRRQNGLCLHCGYDVRASSEICSECGERIVRPTPGTLPVPSLPKRHRWAIVAGVLVCLAAALPWALHGRSPAQPHPVRLAPGTPLSPDRAPARVELEIAPGVTARFALIPAGTFIMGSSPGEAGKNTFETQHQVTISKPFYMAITPVTQEQYAAVMNANRTAYPGANEPVGMVTWTDAAAFCERASTNAGRHIRLPTEAQWEYACRAGTTTPFNVGSKLPRQAADYGAYSRFPGNRHDPRPGHAHPVSVGSFPPNAWGLHDMHGLIWQWCQDSYDEYSIGPVQDPSMPQEGTTRMLRGGAWFSPPVDCRSAARL
jgi:sulfatase modifying factor 1